jgi:hypothetical protein
LPYDSLKGKASGLKRVEKGRRVSDRNSSDVQQLGLLEGGFVDRTPPKVFVRQVLDLMMISRVWGLPVLEHGQDYVGMITAASLFLAVHADPS